MQFYYVLNYVLNSAICHYRLKTAAPYVKCMLVKAGVNVKAALTSLNTAFLPISR